MSLSDVYLTPKMPAPLISVSALRKKGVIFTNEEDGYAEPFTTWKPAAAAKSAVRTLTLMQAHKHFGHVSAQTLKNVINEGHITGVKVDTTTPIHDCEACLTGRAKRKAITKA